MEMNIYKADKVKECQVTFIYSWKGKKEKRWNHYRKLYLVKIILNSFQVLKIYIFRYLIRITPFLKIIHLHF